VHNHQNPALSFGGYEGTTYNATNVTEHYDGSAWTAGGNMGTGRYTLSSAGTLSAGLAFGGRTPSETNATEEYAGPGITTQICSSS